MKPLQKIDLGLAVATAVLQKHPGASIRLNDLADICGCTRQSILNIERAALKKLGVRLRELQTREQL